MSQLITPGTFLKFEYKKECNHAFLLSSDEKNYSHNHVNSEYGFTQKLWYNLGRMEIIIRFLNYVHKLR